jgi:hypothetical protein
MLKSPCEPPHHKVPSRVLSTLSMNRYSSAELPATNELKFASFAVYSPPPVVATQTAPSGATATDRAYSLARPAVVP